MTLFFKTFYVSYRYLSSIFAYYIYIAELLCYDLFQRYVSLQYQTEVMRQAVTRDLYTLNQATAFQNPSRLTLACYEPEINELQSSVPCERIQR